MTANNLNEVIRTEIDLKKIHVRARNLYSCIEILNKDHNPPLFDEASSYCSTDNPSRHRHPPTLSSERRNGSSVHRFPFAIILRRAADVSLETKIGKRDTRWSLRGGTMLGEGWWRRLIYPRCASAGAGWEREARGSEENVLVTRIRLAPGHNLWTSSPGNALCEFLYRDPFLPPSLSARVPRLSLRSVGCICYFCSGGGRWRGEIAMGTSGLQVGRLVTSWNSEGWRGEFWTGGGRKFFYEKFKKRNLSISRGEKKSCGFEKLD